MPGAGEILGQLAAGGGERVVVARSERLLLRAPDVLREVHPGQRVTVPDQGQLTDRRVDDCMHDRHSRAFAYRRASSSVFLAVNSSSVRKPLSRRPARVSIAAPISAGVVAAPPGGAGRRQRAAGSRAVDCGGGCRAGRGGCWCGAAGLRRAGGRRRCGLDCDWLVRPGGAAGGTVGVAAGGATASAVDDVQRVNGERAELTGELQRPTAALLLLDAGDRMIAGVVQRDGAAAADRQPPRAGEIGVGGVVLAAGRAGSAQFRRPPVTAERAECRAGRRPVRDRHQQPRRRPAGTTVPSRCR